MAFYSTISVKGQLSLPAEVRRDFAAEPGTILSWEKTEGGYLVRRKASSALAAIHAITTSHRKAHPPTVAEMDEAIADGIAEKYARSR